jgi:hypothetical protein
MQSSAPTWPGYMNHFLSGPGIASLINTTSNGPTLLFHARHPNNQGGRYLWKYSYLSLKPGAWDVIVRENGIFEPFIYKNDHFAKTGSGQT